MVLVLPAILLLSVIMLAPFVFIIWMSFNEDDTAGLTLTNYEWLVGPQFWPSLYHSLVIGIGSVGLEILAAIPLVLLLNERLPGRGLMRALVTLPWAIPTIAASAAFLWLGNVHYGIINQIGLATGILKEPFAFFQTPSLALPIVTLAHAWKGLPLVFIVLLASLQSLPNELLEAAKIDGARWLAQLRHIILPHLKTAIGLAAVLSGLYNFALFDLTYLLTGGGPVGATMTLPMFEYNQMFRALNTGRAATVGLTIFLAGILTLTLLFVMNARERKRRGLD